MQKCKQNMYICKVLCFQAIRKAYYFMPLTAADKER